MYLWPTFYLEVITFWCINHFLIFSSIGFFLLVSSLFTSFGNDLSTTLAKNYFWAKKRFIEFLVIAMWLYSAQTFHWMLILCGGRFKSIQSYLQLIIFYAGRKINSLIHVRISFLLRSNFNLYKNGLLLNANRS